MEVVVDITGFRRFWKRGSYSRKGKFSATDLNQLFQPISGAKPCRMVFSVTQ